MFVIKDAIKNIDAEISKLKKELNDYGSIAILSRMKSDLDELVDYAGKYENNSIDKREKTDEQKTKEYLRYMHYQYIQKNEKKSGITPEHRQKIAKKFLGK